MDAYSSFFFSWKTSKQTIAVGNVGSIQLAVEKMDNKQKTPKQRVNAVI